jgi:hypothetical protein
MNGPLLSSFEQLRSLLEGRRPVSSSSRSMRSLSSLSKHSEARRNSASTSLIRIALRFRRCCSLKQRCQPAIICEDVELASDRVAAGGHSGLQETIPNDNAASDSVESVQFIFRVWRTRPELAGRWECRDRHSSTNPGRSRKTSLRRLHRPSSSARGRVGAKPRVP